MKTMTGISLVIAATTLVGCAFSSHPTKPSTLGTSRSSAELLVVIEENRIDEVYEAAVERRKKESEIIAKLRQGRTTLELLGLRDPRDGAERK